MYKIVSVFLWLLFQSCCCSCILLPTPEFDFEGNYSKISSPSFPDYSIRLKPQNDSLCNAGVAQYTGWIDFKDIHLFFWYFESQHEPETSPLTLWLAGGPALSSMDGLFGQLGPCLVNEYGNGTNHNPYGWNARTNLLFVDQPAGTGFSYQDEGGVIPDNSFVAASDMADFLILFTTEAFPHLQGAPLHISTESYGGHYVPPLANQIVENNAFFGKPGHLDLRSILIGNGFISPFDILFGYWTTLCTTWPGVDEPVFNETRCNIIAANTPRCLALGRICNANPDPAICQTALMVCNQDIASLYSDEAGPGHRNIFDITAPCDSDPFCDTRVERIVNYLNLPHVRAALDVRQVAGNFSIADDAVEYAFHQTSDLGISMGPEIRKVLENGINMLIYNGNLDLGCNTAGNLKWANDFEWVGQPDFWTQRLATWEVDNQKVGEFKQAIVSTPHSNDTRFAFLTIDGAGHFAPADKPQVTLEMLNQWIGSTIFA